MRFETNTDGQTNLTFTPSEVTALETNPPTQASTQASKDLGVELGYRYPDTELPEVLQALSSLSVPQATFVKFISAVGEGIEKHKSELVELHDRLTGGPSTGIVSGILEIETYQQLHKGAINRELDRRIVGAERDLSGLFKSAAHKARTT